MTSEVINTDQCNVLLGHLIDLPFMRLTCTQNAAADQEHPVVATELREGRHPAPRKKSKAQKTVAEGMDVAFKVSRSHFD